jgi:hypothetical protein
MRNSLVEVHLGNKAALSKYSHIATTYLGQSNASLDDWYLKVHNAHDIYTSRRKLTAPKIQKRIRQRRPQEGAPDWWNYQIQSLMTVRATPIDFS